jgi:Rieske Fe-S protein
MPSSSEQVGATTRRALLVGAAGVGTAAALALAGCGGGGSSSGGGAAAPTTGAAAPTAGAADAIGKTGDVPVGGGTIFQTPNVVVTQPTSGQFKAFDATCTHQRCTVASVRNRAIVCPCHGSQFSITDGSVLKGPATQPLESRAITVSGDNLVFS